MPLLVPVWGEAMPYGRSRRNAAASWVPPHTGEVIGEDFAMVLARAQEGDEVAFAALWRDLNPTLVRHLVVTGDKTHVRPTGR